MDLSKPIPETYDILLAVQPSMLGPQEMDHLVNAVRRGTPTVILEDPHPHLFYPQDVPGTSEPNMSGMGMMGMFGGGGGAPKGDINQLWRTLGIDFNPAEVVWQDYKPELSVRAESDPQWVFIDQGNGAEEPFNKDNPISSGLNQLLLLYPGSITKDADSNLTFEKLAVTNADRSGTVSTMGLQRGARNERVFTRRLTSQSYIVAAFIHGEYQGDDTALQALDINAITGLGGSVKEQEAQPGETPQVEEEEEEEEVEQPAAEQVAGEEGATSDSQPAEASEAEEEEKGEPKPQIRAVVVTDVDWIIPAFFGIRERGDEDFLPATQNVTFILNCIDEVAGDERFIELRKRARLHRTLTKIDAATKEMRDESTKAQEEAITEIDSEIQEAEGRLQKKIAEVEAREDLSRIEKDQRRELVRQREEEKVKADVLALQTKRERTLKQIQYKTEQKISAVQDRYKLYAILVPPIPPLLVALYVFFRRREAEREGISQERLK